MGQLRIVPKTERLRFVEIPGDFSGSHIEKKCRGLIVRCGKFQIDVPADCDLVFLKRALRLLDNL